MQNHIKNDPHTRTLIKNSKKSISVYCFVLIVFEYQKLLSQIAQDIFVK